MKTRSAETEVILISGYASIESVIEAVRISAFHYVTKPLKLNELRQVSGKNDRYFESLSQALN